MTDDDVVDFVWVVLGICCVPLLVGAFVFLLINI